MKKGNEMSGLGIAMSSSTFDSLVTGSSCGQGPVKKGWFNMKKLMFAAAIMAAGAAMAVESNVVGYQNLAMKAGGRQSMCFTFVNMGTNSLHLTDIKVIGYQNSDYWQGEMTCPNIYLKKLATSGAAEATYAWRDNFDDEVPGDWLGGRWRIFGGADIEKGSSSDIEIPAGQGFFVEADQIRDCTSYDLVVNGEVLRGAYAAEMLPGGRLTLGNMMPTDTTLRKVEVQGYQDSDYWQGEMTCPNIYLKKLSTTGAAEATYAWRDNFDDEVPGAWLGGRWRIFGGADLTPETDVPVKAGGAFFVEADQIRDCQKYTLVFPKCID